MTLTTKTTLLVPGNILSQLPEIKQSVLFWCRRWFRKKQEPVRPDMSPQEAKPNNITDLDSRCLSYLPSHILHWSCNDLRHTYTATLNKMMTVLLTVCQVITMFSLAINPHVMSQIMAKSCSTPSDWCHCSVEEPLTKTTTRDTSQSNSPSQRQPRR